MSDTGRRAVPIGELPLDLIAALRDKAQVEGRVIAVGRRRGLGRDWLAVGAAFALAFGLLQAAFVTAPAFTLPERAGSLAVGAGLLAAWLAWRRRPSFRTATGDEGMLVGPTCLVIAGDVDVEVLPAELLNVGTDGITFEGEIVDAGTQTKTWLTSLNEAIERAKTDPDAREADRWRRAAARSSPSAVPAARAAERKPWLLAAAVGALLAVALEAGPVGARGAGDHAEAARTWSDLTTAWREGVSKRAALLDEIGADATARAEHEVAREKARRLDELDKARTGDFATAKKFLDAWGEHDEDGVAERLRKLADERMAGAPTVDDALAILAAKKYGVSDATAARAVARYQKSLSDRAAAAATPDALREVLHDAEGQAELPQAFVDGLRQKVQSAATKKALSGTLDDMRAYLADPDMADAPQRSQVETKISTTCASKYPPLGPGLHLLHGMCVKGSKLLTYTIAIGSDEDLARQAASSFAEDLTELAGKVDEKMEIKAVPSFDDPLVRVSIELSGVKQYEIGGWSQPCTLVVTVLDSPDLKVRQDAKCRERSLP